MTRRTGNQLVRQVDQGPMICDFDLELVAEAKIVYENVWIRDNVDKVNCCS